MNEIENKVAQSGLVEINLDDFYTKGDRKTIDIKDYLFQGLVLKEKEFRTICKEREWSVYKDNIVNIECSNDAIIPMWAYMLIVKYVTNYAQKIVVGTKEELENSLYKEALAKHNWSTYQFKKVMIKGCGKHTITAAAFAYATEFLLPYASSIMYGEACSSVPIHKSK